jgi:hypothetical protein
MNLRLPRMERTGLAMKKKVKPLNRICGRVSWEKHGVTRVQLTHGQTLRMLAERPDTLTFVLMTDSANCL